MLDLLRRGVGMLVKKSFGGDNEAGRAEAALLRVIVNECLLDGMKMAGLAEAFHGGDLRALCVDGQHRAGVHSFVVHQHGASAAGAAIANALGAGKLKLVAQGVQQSDARFELRVELFAVHIERYRNLSRTLDVRLAFESESADVTNERDRGRDAGDFQKVAPGNAGAGR